MLASGWSFIRKGEREAHRACMLGAIGTSGVFLVSYLAYHARVGSVRYEGPGRPAYLALLLSHTLLAAAVPFIAGRLVWLAVQGRFEAHRALGRWGLPVWLYVSVTGVVVYGALYGVGR